MTAPVSASLLSTHLAYTAWASSRLVEAAAGLSAEELTRDFGTADRSVLGTLVHVFAADRIWLARIEGNVPARFVDIERDMRLEALTGEWPLLHERWRLWAAGLTPESVAARIRYADLKGNPHETPLWQIVLHVVNHATHHRGQVSGFLRAMGHTPPPVDLIAYYRSLGPESQ
jgi:uncharacterized damage-inducible protein DinB